MNNYYDYNYPVVPEEDETDTPVKPQALKPVTTTIKHDPVTGEQSMTVKGTPFQLSQAMGHTPTISIPGIQPEEMATIRSAQRNTDSSTRMINQIASGKGIMPVMPTQQPMQPQQQMPHREFGGEVNGDSSFDPNQIPPEAQAGIDNVNQMIAKPAVQVAGVGNAGVADAVAQQTQQPQTTTQVPVEQQTQQQPVVQQEEASPFLKSLIAARTPADYASIVADPNAPSHIKQAASENIVRSAVVERGLGLAQSMTEAALKPDANGKDFTEWSNLLKSNTEEGSYLKAYLFNRLGLTKLADEEQQKLGAGSKWMPTTTGIVEVNGQGLPVRGFNNNGTKMNEEQLLASAGQSLKGTQTHTGKMQDITTGEIYYEQTTPQGIKLVDHNGKPYTGASNNLRAYGIGSDVATKNQIQLNELQNKLAYAGANASATEREKIIAESEAKFGPLPEQYKAQIRAGQAPVGQTATTPYGNPPAAPVAAPAANVNVAPNPAVNQPVNAVIPPQQQAARDVNRVGILATELKRAQDQLAVTTDSKQRDRLQADIAGLQREIRSTGGTAAAPVAPVAATPAAREAAQAVSTHQQKSDIDVNAARIKEEQKNPAEAKGKNEAKYVDQQYAANNAYPIMKEVNSLIRQSTGSGIGAGVDTVAGKFGIGTKGAEAIASLNVLANQFVQTVPRFEGSQSDADVKTYKDAAGSFNNPDLPVKVRLAAFNTMLGQLERWDKEHANDWAQLRRDVGAAQNAGGSKPAFKLLNVR